MKIEQYDRSGNILLYRQPGRFSVDVGAGRTVFNRPTNTMF
ncbi:hypothetical protein [Lentibacillus saliphilus]|nr:hypothetical protein [Lentibacillus saliphilus]